MRCSLTCFSLLKFCRRCSYDICLQLPYNQESNPQTLIPFSMKLNESWVMEREGHTHTHTHTHTEMNKPLLLRSHCYSCICNMSFCLHPASCIRSIAPWNSTILIVQGLLYFGQRTMYMQYSVSLLVSKPSFSDTPARRWEETGFLSLLQTFFAPAFSSTREGLERCPNILVTREAPTKSSLSLSLSLSAFWFCLRRSTSFLQIANNNKVQYPSTFEPKESDGLSRVFLLSCCHGFERSFALFSCELSSPLT